MTRLLTVSDGLHIPPAALKETDLPAEWWLTSLNGGYLLLPRVPDLRKLYVEPTTRCNLRCKTCIRNVWQDPEAHMETALFAKLMDQVGGFSHLKQLVLGGLGEPLVHPDILEMIRLARRQDLAVTLSTNGLRLDAAMARELVDLGVERIVLSLDGATAEAFAGVRGAPIEQVVAHARALQEVKTQRDRLHPVLSVEFVALRHTVGELGALRDLVASLGADRLLVSHVLVYTDEMRDQVLYGYAPRLPLEGGGWPVRLGSWVTWGTVQLPRMHWGAERRCRFVQDHALVVGWDGGVAPCYALAHSYSYVAIDGRRKKVQRYTFGDIAQQPLVDIWTSRDYCLFRRHVESFDFPSCPDCDLRASCDLRAENEACWGWSPSCADCLWAQDIIRCP